MIRDMMVNSCFLNARASCIKYTARFFSVHSLTCNKVASKYGSREKLFCALKDIKSDSIELRPFRISSVLFGKSFSQAGVDVLPLNYDNYGNIFHPHMYRDDADMRSVPDTYYYTVDFATLFQTGIDVLTRYVETGKVEDRYTIPLSRLLGFLDQIEFHQTSLELTSLKHANAPYRESVHAAILANHLLSRLVPDERYILSKDLDTGWQCPCPQKDCMDEIKFGNTSIGYEAIWYGSPDMMLFSDGNTSVIARDYTEINDEDRTDIYDVESDYKGEHVLRFNSTEEQCITQCITFSFHHLDMQQQNTIGNNMQVTLIPTIAVTLNAFDIYMYDYEHDILLRNDGSPIGLWDGFFKDNINVISVIYIWLTINHSLFEANFSPVHVEKLRGSCNFHNLCGDKLRIFQNVRFVKHFSCKRSKGSEKKISLDRTT